METKNFEQKIGALPIEQTIEHLKKERFMYAHFIDGILSGKFRKLSKKQIENIVEKHFFNFEPIITLDSEQEDLLRGAVVRKIMSTLNKNDLRDLCRDVFFDGERIYFGRVNQAKLQTKKYKKLSAEEKINLLFEPNAWRDTPYTLDEAASVCEHGAGFTAWGNRDLIGQVDGYFDTEQEFLTITDVLRQNTEHKKLKILDIGCGMGKALQDAKELDPNLETHGITLEQEAGDFNVDEFHYVAAERMPANFKNKFDLILSNVSFRYYLFQHIALRNAVLSLAKGGQARLSVTCDRIPSEPEHDAYFKKIVPEAENSYYAMKILLTREVEKLKRLERDGKIRLTIYSREELRGQGYYIIEKTEDFDEKELAD